LDPDIGKPWHHACTIDNRDAEIEIRLTHEPETWNRFDKAFCRQQKTSDGSDWRSWISPWGSSRWLGIGRLGPVTGQPYDLKEVLTE
jgi:hypothetical protein